jgi:hypothetical protein
MKTEIGIGILDLYTPEALENCLKSVPEGIYTTIVGKDTNQENLSVSALKNLLIHDFRKKGLKYFFLVHSNQIFPDSEIFERIVRRAAVFGTWFLTGPSDKNIETEDDKGNILKISTELNTEFLFLFYGIVNNNKFFDERFYATKNLDVLDYIIKLRSLNLYLPENYYATITENINKTVTSFSYIKDAPEHIKEKTVQISYGYFYHKYKYIPGQNDPQNKSQEELTNQLEYLQKNYAKT